MEGVYYVSIVFLCMIPVVGIVKLIEIMLRNNRMIRRLKMMGENLQKLVGRQKRAAMLKAAIPLLQPELKDKRRMAKAAETMFYQKETDWAIMGGIASGIGGFGAGLATAVNTQLENARVREYNRTTGAAMSSFVSGVMSNAASRVESNMNYMEREIQELEKVPVLDLPEKELFDMLQIRAVEFKSANTKQILEAVVSLKKEFKHEDVNMCIDGYLKATIQSGGETAEEVVLILPMEGITTVPRKVRGVCMKGGGDSASVQFSAGRLWAMGPRDHIFSAKSIFQLGQSRQEWLVDAMAMPLTETGIWTDVGMYYNYVWGYNSNSHKARIWNSAVQEIARMDNVSSINAVYNKCKALGGSKN